MVDSIKEYEKIVRSCKKCQLSDTRLNVVPGNGNEKAKIMFIRQAPGQVEDETGEEFVGKAGNCLKQALDILGIDENLAYYTSVVKCRPLKNAEPKDEEISCCLNYLRFQVMKIQPKIIVLLGKVAYETIFKDGEPFQQARGKVLTKKGIKYLVTYHPSHVLRNEGRKTDFLEDLAKVKKYYGEN